MTCVRSGVTKKMVDRSTRKGQGVSDAWNSRGLSYLLRETVRVHRKDVSVLEVHRGRPVAEEEEQEVDSLRTVDEVALHSSD